jgi:endonuclease YncB( thermonuclease family)
MATDTNVPTIGHGTFSKDMSFPLPFAVPRLSAYLKRCAAPALLVVPSAIVAGEQAGKVISVHDGDTLTVLVSRQQIKVQLVGIDAPEFKQHTARGVEG